MFPRFEFYAGSDGSIATGSPWGVDWDFGGQMNLLDLWGNL